MVLPAILMYFGTKAAEMYLGRDEEQQATQAMYCTPPPTAPPAQDSVNAPTVTSQIGESKYFSGIVKES